MKSKIILIGAFLFLSANIVFAQPKGKPRSIVSTTSNIKTYNDRKALEGMQKGELQELYMERIKILVNILPNIALATKPGITMSDIGIPDTVDTQMTNTNNYTIATTDFHKKMLPYCDKLNLINCILFYENTLKQLNVLNDTE
jgi:hypothetical protein